MKKALALLFASVVLAGAAFSAPASKVKIALIVESTVDDKGWATVEVKNRFGVGDKLEIIHPEGNQVVTLSELHNHEDMPIQVAPGNGIQVRIPNMQGKEKAVLARLLEQQEEASA